MMHKFGPMARFRVAVMAVVLPGLVAGALSAAAVAADPKVEFKITVGEGANEVNGGGRLYVDHGVFQYETDNLNVTGKVAGDDITLDGTFTTVKPQATRTFKVAGKIVGGHFASSVTATDGKKLGSLSLDLKDE